MILQGKKVLLGVTGSISAYKACDLVQRLKEAGATVRVIMTPSAAKLVHPNTFAALTGYKVATDSFSGTEQGAMEHIDLARWADIYLVAPCTAHTLGEFAQGLTGSLLSLVYLVYEGNAYIAPAMNSVMLAAPAVQRNLALLKEKGDIILPTGEGILACGEVGHGKLLEVPHIVAYVKTRAALRAPYPALAGKRVLISLGHTREPWDDVRFLSNRSSGKTGLAMARAFQLAGAEVTLVAGVTEEAIPPGLETVRVETSAEFHQEMIVRQTQADIVVMAAAIADFVPADTISGKRKDSKSLHKMDLQPFPNILQELGMGKLKGQILVGFALETQDPIAYAERKMTERNCDVMIVNNPVATGSGFGKDTVMAAMMVGGGRAGHASARPAALELMDKERLADMLLAHIDGLLQAA